MYLCIENGELYVTDAPEPMLKANARFVKGFHYEPIHYAHTESIKAHMTMREDGSYHEAVKEMAKVHKEKVTKNTLKRMLSKLTAEQLRELLEDV